MIKNDNILIVEDDCGMRETLSDILSEEGYGITGIGTIARAKKELKNKFYNVAVVDMKLPDGMGLELLDEIKKVSEDTAVIICTGFASIDNAVSALNKGAFSYIRK
ncbi:MAG: response regulator, partial [Candidatus Omnitrophota bacterium]